MTSICSGSKWVVIIKSTKTDEWRRNRQSDLSCVMVGPVRVLPRSMPSTVSCKTFMDTSAKMITGAYALQTFECPDVPVVRA